MAQGTTAAVDAPATAALVTAAPTPAAAPGTVDADASSAVAIQALAGGLGSTAALWLTYPLYTVTLRLQAQHSKQSSGGDARREQLQPPQRRRPTPPGRLSQQSLVTMLRRIVREEGVGALYQGCAAGLFAVSVQSAVFYAFYRVFDASEGGQSAWRALAAAFSAGCCTVCCTHPLWVINYKLTTAAPSGSTVAGSSTGGGGGSGSGGARGTGGAPAAHATAPPPRSAVAEWMRCARALWAVDGVAGLYAGVVPALVLCANPAILFGAYEMLRRLRRAAVLALAARRRRGAGATAATAAAAAVAAADGPVSDFETFLLGGLSKLVSTVLTYPMQTIKTSLSKADTAPSSRKQPAPAAPIAAGTTTTAAAVTDHNASASRSSSSSFTASGTRARAVVGRAGAGATRGGGEKFHGVADAVHSIFASAGLRGFYHGLSTKLVQTTLTAAFTFLLRLRLVAVLRRLLLPVLR